MPDCFEIHHSNENYFEVHHSNESWNPENLADIAGVTGFHLPAK